MAAAMRIVRVPCMRAKWFLNVCTNGRPYNILIPRNGLWTYRSFNRALYTGCMSQDVVSAAQEGDTWSERTFWVPFCIPPLRGAVPHTHAYDFGLRSCTHSCRTSDFVHCVHPFRIAFVWSGLCQRAHRKMDSESGAPGGVGEQLFIECGFGDDVLEMRRLIAAGAPLEWTDEDGWTPLWVAAYNGKMEALQLLLKAGASIRATNKHGWTPLHGAAAGGQADAVRALLEAGADCYARTTSADNDVPAASTAADVARLHSCHAAHAFLQKWEASHPLQRAAVKSPSATSALASPKADTLLSAIQPSAAAPIQVREELAGMNTPADLKTPPLSPPLVAILRGSSAASVAPTPSVPSVRRMVTIAEPPVAALGSAHTAAQAVADAALGADSSSAVEQSGTDVRHDDEPPASGRSVKSGRRKKSSKVEAAVPSAGDPSAAAADDADSMVKAAERRARKAEQKVEVLSKELAAAAQQMEQLAADLTAARSRAAEAEAKVQEMLNAQRRAAVAERLAAAIAATQKHADVQVAGMDANAAVAAERLRTVTQRAERLASDVGSMREKLEALTAQLEGCRKREADATRNAVTAAARAHDAEQALAALRHVMEEQAAAKVRDDDQARAVHASERSALEVRDATQEALLRQELATVREQYSACQALVSTLRAQLVEARGVREAQDGTPHERSAAADATGLSSLSSGGSTGSSSSAISTPHSSSAAEMGVRVSGSDVTGDAFLHMATAFNTHAQRNAHMLMAAQQRAAVAESRAVSAAREAADERAASAELRATALLMAAERQKADDMAAALEQTCTGQRNVIEHLAVDLAVAEKAADQYRLDAARADAELTAARQCIAGLEILLSEQRPPASVHHTPTPAALPLSSRKLTGWDRAAAASFHAYSGEPRVHGSEETVNRVRASVSSGGRGLAAGSPTTTPAQHSGRFLPFSSPPRVHAPR
ncbi:hypothetical protein EON66_00060 [archaeon]|nr:MAG: hypothetical protein EON66_00060 [archaeon]